MSHRVGMIVSAILILATAVVVVPSTATAQLSLEPRCKPLPLTKTTPLVELSDGRLLTIEKDVVITSDDDGKTWSAPHKIEGLPGTPMADCLLLKTRAGALVMVYMDNSTYKWGWDNNQHQAAEDVRLDVWAIRSLDQGKTWTDPQKLLDGYCGALIQMIQTAQGQIVVPVMRLLDRNRHAVFTCVSSDEGKTWQQGNVIDLGGRGHHDGALEPTLIELSSGRILMLLRTNYDRFWEAYSEDQGRYWRELRPSQIDASSAPGYLIRLASGRLALVWNRLYPEGQTTIRRPAENPADIHARECSVVPASRQRAELSLAFSEDDAKTWTKPVVVACQPKAELSYPYVFERRPGELWVIVRYGPKPRFSLKETDFVH